MSDDEKEQQESSLPSLVADLESGDGATIYKYRDFSNVAEDEIEHGEFDPRAEVPCEALCHTGTEGIPRYHYMAATWTIVESFETKSLRELGHASFLRIQQLPLV
jgi:hypothetical protein